MNFLKGLKFYVLNKERYGYLMEPIGAKATVRDSQMRFQHIKLELIGKKHKINFCY